MVKKNDLLALQMKNEEEEVKQDDDDQEMDHKESIPASNV